MAAKDERMTASIADARQAAREEIASLCALVLKRTQEAHLTRDPNHNIAEEIIHARLSAIFGEALSDFAGHTGSGSEPGE